MNNTTLTAAAVAGACFAGAATGALTPSTTVTLGYDSNVSVSFVSQSAGWTGSLYLSGVERNGVVLDVESTDSKDAGQYIFDNHGTAAGATVEVGEFLAGDVLHFDYVVFKGKKHKDRVRYILESDDSAEAIQFAAGATVESDGVFVTRLGIEDIVGNNSDWDYNDLVVDVLATSVPTSGTAALALAAVGLTARRRRG